MSFAGGREQRGRDQGLGRVVRARHRIPRGNVMRAGCGCWKWGQEGSTVTLATTWLVQIKLKGAIKRSFSVSSSVPDSRRGGGFKRGTFFWCCHGTNQQKKQFQSPKTQQILLEERQFWITVSVFVIYFRGATQIIKLEKWNAPIIIIFFFKNLFLK